jgi:hypothetical protein
MIMDITVGILYVAFNRPEISEITFNKIRESQPFKLYIAVDGPRSNNESDIIQVNKVKEIVEKVDWKCEVFYRFNEQNLGAEHNVSSAITWAFEKEESLIILEDDIIAPFSFLSFAQEMLERYKEYENIGIISASNFTPINKPDDPDYFFSKYAHSGGGWATWKRVWQSFDLQIRVEEKHLDMKYLKSISNSRKEALYYRKKFRMMYEKGAGNSSWDRVGNYINRIHKRMNIVPRVNLTSNIGVYGVHAKGTTEFHHLPFDECFSVRNHPDRIEFNTEYDMYHFKTYICRGKKSLLQKVMRKLRKMIH